MANIEDNLNLQPQYFKFSLEIKKVKLDCYIGICKRLQIKYTVKENKEYPNMVTFETMCTLTQIHYFGYYRRDCDIKDKEELIKNLGNNDKS